MDERSKPTNIEEFDFGYVINAIMDSNFGDYGEDVSKMKLWSTLDYAVHDHWVKNSLVLNTCDKMRYDGWKWRKKKLCRRYLINVICQ